MKRRRDLFADEPTTPYETGSVPVAVDEDTTLPVDVGELQVAARRSCESGDAHQLASIPATRTSPHARPRPFVELLVAGAVAVITLPIHRVSATGVVLNVPVGIPVELATDTPVTAVVHLMRRDEEVMRARLPAHVAHHRNPSGLTPGGLSLRWDLRDPGARRAVEALLADPVS